MKKFELVIKSVCEYLVGLGFTAEDIKAMPYDTMTRLIDGKINYHMFDKEANWENEKSRIVDMLDIPKAESKPSDTSASKTEVNKQLINTIIMLAVKSQYKSVADYELYRELVVDPTLVSSDLNTLYKLGYISVKKIRNFKAIVPTSKAYKEFQEARPVSRDACLIIFSAVLDIAEKNTNYQNASYFDIKKVCERRVGAVTLDVALDKLIKAGYLKKSTPTNKLAVFSVTKNGVVAYQKTLGVVVQEPAKTYVKKEMTDEEKQRQSILKELAQVRYVVKAYEKKLERGVAISDEEFSIYSTSVEKANTLRSALELA